MAADYVIVGAGSAGCVLAARLSEDPDVEVLLLEAGGPDTAPELHIPAAFPAVFKSSFDWDLLGEPEPGLNGRRLYMPRGRVIGGSSSINAMIYIRGNRADYDEWAALGCDGWSYDEVLPYFKRAEDNERGASDYHGAGGPLRVSDGRSETEIHQLWLESAMAVGLPANDDFNGAEQEGVGRLQFTTRDGRRESTATAYLHPVEDRPNLRVETFVTVLKIVFDGTRARGVLGLRLGEEIEFRAEREVLLCAGAYGSPQLLMLSGVGRAAELEQLMIEPVAEVPGVGMNLHDHPINAVSWRSDREDTWFEAFNEENLARWEQEGRGPIACAGIEVGGFTRSREGLPAVDMQIYGIPAIIQDEA